MERGQQAEQFPLREFFRRSAIVCDVGAAYPGVSNVPYIEEYGARGLLISAPDSTVFVKHNGLLPSYIEWLHHIDLRKGGEVQYVTVHQGHHLLGEIVANKHLRNKAEEHLNLRLFGHSPTVERYINQAQWRGRFDLSEHEVIGRANSKAHFRRTARELGLEEWIPFGYEAASFDEASAYARDFSDRHVSFMVKPDASASGCGMKSFNNAHD